MLFVFLRKHKGTVISAINKKSVGMYFQLDVSVICFRRCRVYSRQRQIYIYDNVGNIHDNVENKMNAGKMQDGY